jgi:hypothetical protein
MAPKKTRKSPQDSMLKEPVDDRIASPESIGEEEPMPREDRDEPESEEEQRSSVLFTQEQLEILLKMGRLDFGELVAALKTGAAKGERFQPAKPGNFNGVRDRKVVDAWLAEMDDYLHAAKVGRNFGGACPILLERLCHHMVEDGPTRGGEEPWLHMGVL